MHHPPLDDCLVGEIILVCTRPENYMKVVDGTNDNTRKVCLTLENTHSIRLPLSTLPV